MSEAIRQLWTGSRTYRIALGLAAAYFILRLSVHGTYAAVMLVPEAFGMEMPGWAAGETGSGVPVDLQLYLDAAARVKAQAPLYLNADKIEVYQYPPAYAVAFMPFLLLPAWVTVALHSAGHVAAYVALYFVWSRIFARFRLMDTQTALATALPVWLIFSSFWSDLGYLNIYIVVALLSSLLIEAILDERLGASLLWLSLILQIKPHWAFALAVPFAFGRWRFLGRLLGLAALTYAAVVGIAMWVAGPSYIVEQVIAYPGFLKTMTAAFPWRGPDAPFLGYNHAVRQVMYYLFGITPAMTWIATGIKIMLLLPLAITILRRPRQSDSCSPGAAPQLALDLAFAAYLGAFIWLDWVWEVSLGPVIFAYLLGTTRHQSTKVVIWAAFLPYALIDVIRLVTFAALGMKAIAPGLYILTDPSIYLPLMLAVIIIFYTLLVRRAWETPIVREQQSLGRTSHGS